MKIAKEVREEASELLSMCACDRAIGLLTTTGQAASWGEASREAERLADRAWWQVGGLQGAVRYAEAEALLRTGWSP